MANFFLLLFLAWCSITFAAGLICEIGIFIGLNLLTILEVGSFIGLFALVMITIALNETDKK